MGKYDHWINARPFYWSRGVERITNGRWTIEVTFFHDSLEPTAVIEWPSGLSTYHYRDRHGNITPGDYLPAKYVLARADKLLRKVEES